MPASYPNKVELKDGQVILFNLSALAGEDDTRSRFAAFGGTLPGAVYHVINGELGEFTFACLRLALSQMIPERPEPIAARIEFAQGRADDFARGRITAARDLLLHETLPMRPQ